MAKKKRTKKARKEKKEKKQDKLLRSILEFPFKLLQFLVLLPFKIYRYLNKKSKEKKEIKIKQEKQAKRESIEARYEEFRILEKFAGELRDWELLLPKSSVGIILGARGKGKSAIGVKILENIRAYTKKKIVAMGFIEEDLPAWIDVVEDMKDISNNSFVLIDEGGILFSSRKSMTDANQVLSDLILISRHKNLSILFISQNSANLDINILRQADYLILKPSSLLQKDFERKKIKELYDEVKEGFERYKEDKGLTYIYSEQFRGFISNPLPSFWTKDISTSFK